METTLRARVHFEEVYPILDAMGEHLGSCRRSIFKDLKTKARPLKEIKREALVKYGITARQFNSIRYELQGLIKANEENKKSHIGKILRRIQNRRDQLKKTLNPFKRHHIKRKLIALENKLTRLQGELDKVSICFGGRRLFQKQFHLEENGYQDHEEWKKDWKTQRDSHFFLIGSKDEKFGNQSCKLLPGRLQLRLTDKLVQKFGSTTVDIPLQFTYRTEVIEAALVTGQAIHYRFVKENHTWYVHLTTDIQEIEFVTNRKYGALGIDLNPSCIAVTEIGPDGNLIGSWQVDLNLRGRTKDQLEATLGEEISKLVNHAKENQIPIVIEELDFEKKKDELRSRNLNRMLSNFAYSKFFDLIKSQSYRAGVELIRVNPAYTSMIGKHKFSEGYGISTHMAAAMAIARRGLGFGERLRVKAQVRSFLPVTRNRNRHVLSDWRRLRQKARKRDGPPSSRHHPEWNRGDEKSSSAPSWNRGEPLIL
jgi:IS605 OrfB family transposase